MRPTRRGLAVLGLAVAAFAMASAFGARTLNTVTGPAVVALLAAVVTVARSSVEGVERSRPAPGFPGERRTISLDVHGRGLARVSDSFPAALDTVGPTVETTLPDTVTYEIELLERGESILGPPTVVVSDVLGLVEQTVQPAETVPVLVYPRVYDLRDHDALAGLFDHRSTPERQAFDSLREYAPGDPLRDVHWKSSAKRGENDLVVKEFVGEAADGSIEIAASAADGHADEMASAAASVALLALRAGQAVGVACPGGELPPGSGDTHRGHLLELLARTDAGVVAEAAAERADVRIVADDDGIGLWIDGHDHTLTLPATGASRDADATAVAADGGVDR